MSALTGRKAKNTYGNLLQVDNSNNGVDATLRDVEDGRGTISAIKLSTTTLQIPASKTLAVPGTLDITGATFTGTVPVSGGGTGAATSAAARTNLGLEIDVDVQAYDATLTSIAALGTAADRYAYTTGVDTWVEGTITAAGRAILDDADAAAQRTTLELGALATLDSVGTAQIGNDAVTADKLANTSVIAGTYNSADITVDAQGRITSAEDGQTGWNPLETFNTSSGSVHENTAVPAGVTRVRFDFQSVNVSTSADIQLELGDSTAYASTSTGAITTLGAASLNTGNFSSGPALLTNGLTTALDLLHGKVECEKIGNNWAVAGALYSGQGAAVWSGGGLITLTSALTRLKLTLDAAGNYAGGSVQVSVYSE
ncbi:MAG: hypothetical protein QNJ62_05185 [Methyloceanibacter sp.]|nr:hypothetical protein [Methyloceanibacter sp.]